MGSAGEAASRANLEFAYSESDCSTIQASGGCAGTGDDDDLLLRASVAMNAYCQATGRNTWNCFFNGTCFITITIPVYVSAQEEAAGVRSSVFFRVNRCVNLNRDMNSVLKLRCSGLKYTRSKIVAP